MGYISSTPKYQNMSTAHLYLKFLFLESVIPVQGRFHDLSSGVNFVTTLGHVSPKKILKNRESQIAI